jgi:hypothetical protein
MNLSKPTQIVIMTLLGTMLILGVIGVGFCMAWTALWALQGLGAIDSYTNAHIWYTLILMIVLSGTFSSRK